MRQLGASALFAAHFREVAGRALLLPRRRVGQRTALWQQRKRAADLLAVASRYGSFPAVLETYRECLRDVFDMPALVDTLTRISRRAIRVVTVDTPHPSPFAASLLFNYVASFLYDGDAPLAERRAQALSVDYAQLRELMGDAELRELIDADVLEALERQLQGLDDDRRARSVDALHDLLLRVGDLSRSELAVRTDPLIESLGIAELLSARRAVEVPVTGEPRVIAVEDAARYRDALGCPLPLGLPQALLEPVADPLTDLVQRYARTHGPFTTATCAARFGLAVGAVDAVLERLRVAGRVVQGEFRPGGTEREWCGRDVLATLRQRSLARLRRQVEPVDAAALGRFTASWQGIVRRRTGLDALLDAVEQLQGTPLPASELEREILPARVEGYEPSDLDRLLAAGEVVWLGVEPLGERDGRLALYLTDHLRLLRPPDGGSDVDERSRAADRRASRLLGGLLLPGTSRGHRGRFPAGSHRRALGSRLAWRGHERHAACAPRVRRAGRTVRRAPDARPSGRGARCHGPRSGDGRSSRIVCRDVRPAPSGPRPSRVSCSRVTAS